MKEKVIVLNSNPYSMTDENTGVINQGLIVKYVAGLEVSERDVFKGVDIFKANFPIAEKVKVTKAPAMYEIDFSMGADSKGKPKLIYNTINFVSDLKM